MPAGSNARVPKRARFSPVSITDMFLDELEEWMTARGQPTFRARQIAQWIYVRGVIDYDAMTNLPRSFRNLLDLELPPVASEIIEKRESRDGTTKLLLRLRDGETIETVLIPDGNRRTACVSSQVGCGIRCIFCASGLLGLRRHLRAGEMVDQVVHLRRLLPLEERITNVVFMGMGEPLANYANLDRAIRILNADWGCGIGKRHITVSTTGFLQRVKRLARDHPQVTLAISLHAPNDTIRKKIVPHTKKVSVQDLVGVAHEYLRMTGRRPTFEYCLIGGINDARHHAEELALLLRGLTCYVNLIPWNPIEGTALSPPSKRAVKIFASILADAGLEAAIRTTRGADIEAACGQLKLHTERSPVS